MYTPHDTKTPSQFLSSVYEEALIDGIIEAGDRVSSHALYEIATDPYPPKVVQEIIEQLCVLLGLQLDWNEVKKLIMAEKLHKMIQDFIPDSVPDAYLEQLSEICKLDEMQIVSLESLGAGVSQLGEWMHSIALYYDVKNRPEIYNIIETQPEPEVEVKPTSASEIKDTEKTPKEEPKTPPAKRIISIKEALESIKNLNKQDITEVKGYKKPPAGVLLVLEALCILFDAMKVEKKGNQIICEPNYKKLLQDPDDFIRKVLDLDFDHISLDKIKKLRLYIVKPEFEIEKVKRASRAAASFSLLIISLVQKYDEQKTS